MTKPRAFSSEAACSKRAQRKTQGDITDAGPKEDLTIRDEALCAHYGLTPTRAVDACYHRPTDMMSAPRLVCLRHRCRVSAMGGGAICVGIDFGAISSKMRLSDHAARSIA
jgi:hypothetical protein